MNWIDRTIAAVSPEAGLRRARARAAMSHVQRLAYDGAKAGRRTAGWFRPGTSANAEVGAQLKQLRDGARDLVRNFPLARKALWELRTKTVGTGIRPQARTGDTGVDATLDSVFEQLAGQCNADGRPGYYGMQSLAAAAMFEGGEALWRTRIRDRGDGPIVEIPTRRGRRAVQIPLQFQLLEGDFLDHSKTQQTDTGYIIQGVQFNKIGKRETYWLTPSHPGDVVNTGWFRNRGITSAPVPASEVEHLYVVERPGQVRGVTWFSAVLTAMHDLDGYQDAERVRKRIEACLAAFVTSPESDSGGAPRIGQQETSDGIIEEEFSPGMITRMRQGEEVTIAEPKAAGGYGEYVRTEDHRIAAGLGLPYAVLTGDLSQTNYSSYRGGLLSFRDLIEFLRWECIIPVICEPVWRRVVDACILLNLVPDDTPYTVEWAPPAFDLLDRGAEAEADEKMLRIGTMTWPQAVGRQGYDPAKQLEEIAAWNKRMDEAAIVLDSDPRKTNRSGATQNAAEDNSSPAAA